MFVLLDDYLYSLYALSYNCRTTLFFYTEINTIIGRTIFRRENVQNIF